MPTYALTLEYDGTDFHGWQVQPGVRTVAGVLQQALHAVTQEEPRLTAAGRTDAGAHAHGQVAGCTLQRAWEPERLRLALNAALPEDVVVTEAALRADTFHARRDALLREYRYVVVARGERAPVTRRHSWTVRGPLALGAMRDAAARLCGTHDFGAFGGATNPGGSTVRTVHAVSVERVAPGATVDAVVITVRADAFLRGMMRAFSGALVRVGQGRAMPAWIDELLASPRQRAPIPVAPARGLHQWHVAYIAPAGVAA